MGKFSTGFLVGACAAAFVLSYTDIGREFYAGLRRYDVNVANFDINSTLSNFNLDLSPIVSEVESSLNLSGIEPQSDSSLDLSEILPQVRDSLGGSLESLAGNNSEYPETVNYSIDN